MSELNAEPPTTTSEANNFQVDSIVLYKDKKNLVLIKCTSDEDMHSLLNELSDHQDHLNKFMHDPNAFVDFIVFTEKFGVTVTKLEPEDNE